MTTQTTPLTFPWERTLHYTHEASIGDCVLIVESAPLRSGKYFWLLYKDETIISSEAYDPIDCTTLDQAKQRAEEAYKSYLLTNKGNIE